MARSPPQPTQAPLPQWRWQDLEQTLYSMAETPYQGMVARHFLSSLTEDPPSDARTILLEIMRITMVMHALEPASDGTAPHLPRQLHG